MAEGYRHTAGGGNVLSVIRHGREEMTEIEGVNDEGSELLPGEAVMLGENSNGAHAFSYHDGSADEPVYIVKDASDRGMTADVSSGDGFADGEGLTAIRASGGGVNIKLSTGETLARGDLLGVDSNSTDGTFTNDSANYNAVYGELDEDIDTSGASNPALAATEVSN